MPTIRTSPFQENQVPTFFQCQVAEFKEMWTNLSGPSAQLFDDQNRKIKRSQPHLVQGILHTRVKHHLSRFRRVVSMLN